jgi:subtilisin family serine protease
VDFNNDMGLAATLPWVISLGALVGSHPYGHKLFSFLDGSSNEELAIDLAYEEQGAIQVVSVGNEAQNRDDASAEVPPEGEGPVSMPFTVTHYDWASTQVSLVAITVRWRRPEAMLSFTVVDPEGNEAALGSGAGLATVGPASVDHSREDSERGTAKFDVIVSRRTGALAAGDWTLLVDGDGVEPVTVTATMMNDLFRGGMGTTWADDSQVDPMATVSAYATADRAVGACSYGTRHSRRGEVIGDISGFSSRGPRIDGARIVDVCAPGDNDIIWAQSSRHDYPLGAYSFGGGTSASAPHVAGALALLRQAAPWATATEIEDALLGGALADELVGEVPGHVWGFGKLRVDSALALLPPARAEEAEEPDLRPWERGLSRDAGAPPAAAGLDPLVGVEGGGCHCRAAGAGLPSSTTAGLRRLAAASLGRGVIRSRSLSEVER